MAKNKRGERASERERTPLMTEITSDMREGEEIEREREEEREREREREREIKGERRRE